MVCICKHQVLFPCFLLSRFYQNGTWASEDSVSAEKRQETGRAKEGQGSRSKDSSQGGTRVHLPCVQGEYEVSTLTTKKPKTDSGMGKGLYFSIFPCKFCCHLVCLFRSVWNLLFIEKSAIFLRYIYRPFLQSQMPDPKTFKQHFESKHPKSPLPPELEGVEA